MRRIHAAIFTGLLTFYAGCTDANTQQPQAITPSVAEQSVSMSEYDRVQSGMTLAEVEAILGKGEEISSSEVSGIKSQIYIWKNKNFSNITLTLQNGAVVSKAQTGLQ